MDSDSGAGHPRQRFSVTATVEVANADEAEHIGSREETRRHRTGWDRATTIQAAIALFTLVAASAAVRVMYLTQDTLIASQRAWVTIDKFTLLDPLAPNRPVHVKIGLGNSGHSPAYGFEEATALLATVTQPLPKPKYGAASHGTTIVGPGTTQVVELTTPEGMPDANYKAVVTDGTQSLYLRIKLTYLHPYGSGGVEFCAQYSRDRETFVVCNSGDGRVW